MKLHERLAEARDKLPKVQPKYCIVWEDPEGLDAPCKITTPAPEWLACALAGNILPPVEVYHRIRDSRDERGALTEGHVLHDTPPIGPMTEEQAMEYLVKQAIPPRVWRDNAGNRQRFKIVPRDLVPSDRTFRNAWRIL